MDLYTMYPGFGIFIVQRKNDDKWRQLHKDTVKLMYASMWLMRFLMSPLNAIDQMFSDFGGTWKNTGKKKKSWCKSHYIVTTDVFLHLFQTNNYCCFKYNTLTLPRHRGISQRKAVQTRVACSKCTSISELIAAERKGGKKSLLCYKQQTVETFVWQDRLLHACYIYSHHTTVEQSALQLCFYPLYFCHSIDTQC